VHIRLEVKQYLVNAKSLSYVSSTRSDKKCGILVLCSLSCDYMNLESVRIDAKHELKCALCA